MNKLTNKLKKYGLSALLVLATTAPVFFAGCKTDEPTPPDNPNKPGTEEPGKPGTDPKTDPQTDPQTDPCENKRDETYVYDCNNCNIGIDPKLTLEKLYELNADCQVRYVIQEIVNVDHIEVGRNMRAETTRSFVGLWGEIFSYSEKAKAGTTPIGNINIFPADSAKLFGTNKALGELGYIMGENVRVVR